MSYQQYRYFNIQINKKGYKRTEPLDEVIKIKKPSKVKSILQLLFDKNEITITSLTDHLKVDTSFLSNILGIDKEFFEKYEESEYKQFTVSDLKIKNNSDFAG